jgi:hypothetical protein
MIFASAQHKQDGMVNTQMKKCRLPHDGYEMSWENVAHCAAAAATVALPPNCEAILYSNPNSDSKLAVSTESDSDASKSPQDLKTQAASASSCPHASNHAETTTRSCSASPHGCPPTECQGGQAVIGRNSPTLTLAASLSSLTSSKHTCAVSDNASHHALPHFSAALVPTKSRVLIAFCKPHF